MCCGLQAVFAWQVTGLLLQQPRCPSLHGASILPTRRLMAQRWQATKILSSPFTNIFFKCACLIPTYFLSPWKDLLIFALNSWALRCGSLKENKTAFGFQSFGYFAHSGHGHDILKSFPHWGRRKDNISIILLPHFFFIVKQILFKYSTQY